MHFLGESAGHGPCNAHSSRVTFHVVFLASLQPDLKKRDPGRGGLFPRSQVSFPQCESAVGMITLLVTLNRGAGHPGQGIPDERSFT